MIRTRVVQGVILFELKNGPKLQASTFYRTKKKEIYICTKEPFFWCSPKSNYFAESVKQDQPAHTCSLILLCAVQCTVIDICPPPPPPPKKKKKKILSNFI